jgi:hypothetical protein
VTSLPLAISPVPTEGLTLIVCAEAGEAKTAIRAIVANTKANLVFRVDTIQISFS